MILYVSAGFSRPYEGVAQSALVSDTPGDLCDEGRWTVGKSLLSTSFSKAPPRQISPQKHVQPLSSGQCKLYTVIYLHSDDSWEGRHFGQTILKVIGPIPPPPHFVT